MGALHFEVFFLECFRWTSLGMYTLCTNVTGIFLFSISGNVFKHSLSWTPDTSNFWHFPVEFQITRFNCNRKSVIYLFVEDMCWFSLLKFLINKISFFFHENVTICHSLISFICLYFSLLFHKKNTTSLLISKKILHLGYWVAYSDESI